MAHESGEIEVRGDGPSVFLLTLNGGANLGGTLARALERGRARWGDAAGLASVILQEMTSDGDKVFDFGISAKTSGVKIRYIVDAQTGQVTQQDLRLVDFDDFIPHNRDFDR